MVPAEAIQKLKALRGSVDAFCSTYSRGLVPLRLVADFFARFGQLRENLMADMPSMFGDLTAAASVQRDDIMILNDASVPYIRPQLLTRLLTDIDYCLELASGVCTPQLPEVRREGIFLAGQHYDAFRFVSGLVSSAKSSIFVIDAYADDKVVEVLAMKAAGVEVRILAQQPTKPSLKPAAESFNKQHGGLSVRLSSKFHDRFLILDDSEFYHFGASFNRLGERAFMFSRIEEPLVIDALKAAVAQEWAKATVAISAPASSGAP